MHLIMYAFSPLLPHLFALFRLNDDIVRFHSLASSLRMLWITQKGLDAEMQNSHVPPAPKGPIQMNHLLARLIYDDPMSNRYALLFGF